VKPNSASRFKHSSNPQLAKYILVGLELPPSPSQRSPRQLRQGSEAELSPLQGAQKRPCSGGNGVQGSSTVYPLLAKKHRGRSGVAPTASQRSPRQGRRDSEVQVEVLPVTRTRSRDSGNRPGPGGPERQLQVEVCGPGPPASGRGRLRPVARAAPAE
jgi:hypothetical protein